MPRRFAFSFAALLVTIAACGSTSPSKPPADVSIVLGASTKTNAAFDPDSFTITLGLKDSVTWRNDDATDGNYPLNGIGVNHHIVSDSAGVFDSGIMTPGATFVHRFTGAGTFRYHCPIHPTMVGVIVVRITQTAPGTP